ncbi:hypothetical protein G6F70_004189 [Rhizopus microsporus]|nr:hypothetical protein G6F71_002677 [Rhizopus microsporus]KAG1200300.1 hypothetical protein G6F70_004189 [Rhizopus microsporus]KAG1214805.1 hypothetical protein G6F69_001565 [Rhizopus microsporus]KAG1233886.1 hypothetical protein G6F67_003962 [Rhizopus microsporus]KAG1267010.1 hypothetical protein G6F68_002266 [Rhizopus microsporus]
MSLVVTKNYHYALLVAIDEGQHFGTKPNLELYISARLDIKLPPTVDDLIPPKTRISTQTTSFTQTPRWRTALIYFISKKFLHTLMRTQSDIKLEIMTVSEDMHRESLGLVELPIDQAKLVRLNREGREMTQVQQFVINKGDWLNVKGAGRAQIKAGLFIVEMNHNTTPATMNKDVATPLQLPVKTNNQPANESDPGMEITDMSNLFDGQGDATFFSDEGENDILFSKSDYIQNDDEVIEEVESLEQLQDKSEYLIQEEYEDEPCIRVDEKPERYCFLFRLIEAKYMSSIMENYSNVEKAFLRYVLADREYEVKANLSKDKWEVVEYQKGIPFQGSLQKVQEWLSSHEKITVYLMVEYTNGEQDYIAYSDIYLKGRNVDIVEQTTIIYDKDKMWHINQDKIFTKLHSKLGLVKGWEALEEDIL